MIGERPCAAGVDEKKLDELVNICAPIITEVSGYETSLRSASTDCNIPMSYGIPAICIATCESYGPHKREEKLKKSSLIPGLEIALLASIEYAK